MSRYRVELTRAAGRDLDRLTARDFAAVGQRIDALAADPRPPGAAKLKGRNEYKLRVGRFRVVYDVQDERLVVLVMAVDDRKQVYQRLRRR